MRKRRGYMLVEVLVGLGLLALLFIAGMSLFGTSLKSLRRTDTKLDLSQTNALALRKVTEEIRSAYSLDIEDEGRTIVYEMPDVMSNADPVTGEIEYKYPMVSDGIVRTVYFEEGKLWYRVGDGTPKVLADNIVGQDPDPESSYHGQDYPMFAFANVGAANGLKLIFITEDHVSGGKVYNRQTLTVFLRNYR